MKIVTECLRPPHTCAVLPHRHNSDRFIETGTELPAVDPEIYVSESAVHEMARLFGYLAPFEADAQNEAIEGLEARVAELEEQATESDRAWAAIDVIESKDFRARKKSGRKPTKSQEEAAA